MEATPDFTSGGGKMQAVETRRDSRRSHEARARFWHVAIVSSFFVAMLGASLFLGAVMVVGAFHGGASNEFMADGRTGRVARSLLDGTFCRYIMFDNKTAQAVEDRIGRCDEGKPKPKPKNSTAFS